MFPQENPRFSWWFFSNPFERIWSSNCIISPRTLGYENGLRPWKLNMEPQKIKAWFRWFSFSRLGDFQVPAVGGKKPKIPPINSLQKRHPRYPTSTHRPPWIPPSLEALAQAQSVGLRKAFSALLWQAPQKLVPWLVGWLLLWWWPWKILLIIEFDKFVDFKD